MRTEPVGTIEATVLEEAAREGRVQELEYDGLKYLRFADKHHAIPRGTVVAGGHVIPGYPPIGRVFVLERGIGSNFTGTFVAEEKIDGYNVRVASVNGRSLAFTRGGFACPFTNDRLSDLAQFKPLFTSDSNLVVCGEVAGPGNPYISNSVPQVREDIAFFAFDLMHLDRNGFVAIAQRDEIFQRFSIPRAPSRGRFDPSQIGDLRRLVLELDAGGIEGLVFKGLPAGPRVKYVTPRTNLDDIVVDAPYLAELPESFFQLRLLRLALGITELDLQARIPEMEQKLGQALVSRFLHTVESVAAGGTASERLKVKLRSRSAASRLLEHLNHVSRTVRVREVDCEQVGDWTVLTLEKTYITSTSRIQTLLTGCRVID